MLSIIISTYNRKDSLKDTLDSLKGQQIFGDGDLEVLVVDNNSSDGTADFVREYSADFFVPLRYVFEQQQGLSYARNRGIQEARGEILAFTDDDVILDKDWVSRIFEFCSQHAFTAMGGRVLPLYPDNTPAWIKQNQDILKGPILCHDYGADTRRYDHKMDPFVGANIVIPRATLDEQGLFRTDMGLGAGTLGEDTDYFLRLRRLNKDIYYCGAVCLRHKADKARMNLRYFAQWNLKAGRYYALNEPARSTKDLACWVGVPRYLYRRTLCSVGQLIAGLFNRRRFLQAWNRLFINLGMIRGYRILNKEVGNEK